MEIGPPGILLAEFPIQDAPPQLKVVAFWKELPELGWVSQIQWALAQGPIMHPCNHRSPVQGLPNGPDANCLWSCNSRMHRSQWYASMGLAGPLRTASCIGSHCHCSDSMVWTQSIRHTSGPGHL